MSVPAKEGGALGDHRLVAVIDIGTSAIRMNIAEITPGGDILPLEVLSQSVPLGRDTFTRGRIRRSTLEESVRVLRSFQELMQEYRVGAKQVRAVATSAVQEAANRQHFVDRVYMATGIDVEIIEGAEATRLTYLSVSPFLKGKKTERTAVVEVGGGLTELLLLEGDQVVATRVVRLGSVRLFQLLEQQHTAREDVRPVLDQELVNAVQKLTDGLPAKPDRCILLGGEARFVAERVNPDWDRRKLQTVRLKDWSEMAKVLLALSTDEIVHQHHLTYEEADTLGPALYAMQAVASALGMKAVQVGGLTMRDGLLHEMAAAGAWSSKYVCQIIDSAREVGARYQIDWKHATEVSGLALQLFDALQGEHKLKPRARVLLEVAALLHEIGSFVSAAAHHKHSLYLLLNSDVFGLGRTDKRIVANVARYHRRSGPKPAHTHYASLSREDRIRVLQLSGMLRVADALARSRGKRIKEIHCERRESDFVIRVPDVDSLHLEQAALERRGDVFKDVFGMNVILVKG